MPQLATLRDDVMPVSDLGEPLICPVNAIQVVQATDAKTAIPVRIAAFRNRFEFRLATRGRSAGDNNEQPIPTQPLAEPRQHR